MDENDDYFKLGEEILTRQMNSMSLPETEEDNSSYEENQMSNNFQKDQLYAKCQLIYQFFLTNEISSFSQPIEQNLKDQVDSEVKSLLEILENEGKSPSIANFQNNDLHHNRNGKISELYSHLGALNILSFALLLLQNNDKFNNQDLDNKKDFTAYYDKLLESRSDEIVQHEKLKEKYKRLHDQIKEYETVFSMVAKKMNLPDKSDFSVISSELALFNFSNNNNDNNNNSNNSIILHSPQEDKLRKYLISKFNIANESSSDEIINMIEMELSIIKKNKAENKASNDSIKKFFIQMMDMPENSDNDDVKIKLGKVLDQIQTLKSEINFLKDKLARQKTQNQETLDELEKLKAQQNPKNSHVSLDQAQKSQGQIQGQTQTIETPKEIESSESEVFMLKSEIESLKISLTATKDKLKTVRDQNKLLKTISKDSINESRTKTNTITELTAQINDLALKNSELERSLSEISSQKVVTKTINFSETKNVNDAFEYLRSQIEMQSNELSQMSENRNELYRIINKQEKVIDFLDNKFLQHESNDSNSNSKKVINSSDEILFLEKNLISLAEEFNRTDLISALKGDSKQSEERKVLISMNDEENRILNSIIFAFSILLANSKVNQEPNATKKEFKNSDNDEKTVVSPEKVDFSSFKEVCEYLSSILVFFDKISNSSETLDWIFSNNYYVNSGENSIGLNLNPYLVTGKNVMRETLINLVQRISYFLADRKIDFVPPDFLHITENILPKVSQKVQQKDVKNLGNDVNETDNDEDNFGDDEDENNEDNEEDDKTLFEDENSSLQLQRVSVVLSVADVLKNYSVHLEEKVDELGMALRELKDELIQSEMATNDAKGLLQLEQRKNQKLIDELELLESKLKAEKEKNHRREKEKEKNENEENQARTESTEMHPNNVTLGLNNDSKGFYIYNQAISKNEDEEDDKKKLKKCQKLLKLMKKKYEKILKEQEKKVNILSDKIIDTQNELNSTKEVNDQLTKENKEISQTLAVMTERLSQFEIEKDQAVTAKAALIEADCEEKLDEQKKLNRKLVDRINEMRKTVEMAEDAQNIENKNLQKENKELFSKIEEIRSNYETLITSYKQKYSEFSEREKKLVDENSMQTESLKKLNKELNEARIENKICALKNKTLTEKIDRQTSLHLTQTTALSTNFETKLNEKLKMAEIEYENQKRKFLNSLFEQLKDFYDFTHSMNEENCIKIVSMLVSQLKVAKTKENNGQKSIEIIEEMKKEMNVKTDNELLTKVLLLSSLSSSNSEVLPLSLRGGRNAVEGEFDGQNNVLNGKVSTFESALKNWRRWANSMNSILSDNFSSYCATSAAFSASLKNKSFPGSDLDPNVDSELRSKVEEKILSSVGKRRIFRRIEILRNEKIIFLKLLEKYGSVSKITENDRRISLQTVLCVVICMRRIMKISGKLPSISLGKNSDGSILTNSSINNSDLSRSTGSYRYSYDENPNYSSMEYNYNTNSSSQYQHKKKPIIAYT